MHFPKSEPEFVGFVHWVRPSHPHESNALRAAKFSLRLKRHPSLAGIKVLAEQSITMERALEFRSDNRPGLYIACLVYLGLEGHPIACLTLAGILAQRAQYKIPHQRILLRRAIGWLKVADDKDFQKEVGILPEAFARIEKASSSAVGGKITDLRRQIERNERRVTLIDGPLPKWRSETSSSEKYQCLTQPLDLKGELTTASADALLEALRAEYPWAHEMLSDIETALILSVSANNPWLSIPPLLLVGPPGIGKTRFARLLAELVAVPLRIVNASGSADNRDFAGTSRAWSTAQPARIIDILRETGVANPIVLVDEIDKAGGNERHGRITATLLTMLEPETKARFYDECLTTNVDLSFVNWIFTANSVKDLGRPLLSRMRIIHMQTPPASAANKIIESILRDIAARFGWPFEAMPTFDPKVYEALVKAMSDGAGPRSISAMLEQVLAIELKKRRACLN